MMALVRSGLAVAFLPLGLLLLAGCNRSSDKGDAGIIFDAEAPVVAMDAAVDVTTDRPPNFEPDAAGGKDTVSATGGTRGTDVHSETGSVVETDGGAAEVDVGIKAADAPAADASLDVPAAGSGGTGGTTTSGGIAATGGGTGGVPTTGGSTTAGGTTASDGTMSTGGSPSTGGTASTGGTTARGGTTADGGTSGAALPSCRGLAATCGPSGNGDCCASLPVPGGTFNRSDDPNSPATVDAFFLDKYEITVGRFRQFVNAGMGTQSSPPAAGAGMHPLITGSGWNPAWNTNLLADTAALTTALKCWAGKETWTDTAGASESQPQNCIDWYTAFAFCAWDGGRLATEAEWNYAAAGGSEQRYYPWSDPPTSTTIDDSYAVYCGSSCLSTQNVGSKSPKGDGKWGQADLAGNLWEWTLDWYGAYQTPCNNCADLAVPTGRMRRGGGFYSNASGLTSALRKYYGFPGSRDYGLGARCARISGATGFGGATGSGGSGGNSATGGTGGVGGTSGSGGNSATGGTGAMGGTPVVSGTLRVLAGVPSGRGTADGTGPAARFDYPHAVAVDGAGNVYVADGNNHTIRKVTPSGAVTTLAGTPLYSGSGTWLSNPASVAVDGVGNVYLAANFDNRIWKATPSGAVTTLAGSTSSGAADGIGANALFKSPEGLALDGAGNVYVADTGNNTIRKITPAGAVTTFAGTAGPASSADGTGADARFNGPQGIAVDGAGNVYVADTGASTIRKITPAAVVTTFAGAAGNVGADDGMGTAARFNSPTGVAVDGTGTVYVSDSFNGTIRKIATSGAVTTLAGTAGSFGNVDGTGAAARFDRPEGVATDGAGNIYVADTSNSTIRKITPVGAVTTLAGTGVSSGSADGAGADARFGSFLNGVAVDGSGTIYVSDTGNCSIRKVTPAGSVTTLAGGVGLCRYWDALTSPYGVAVDGAGTVYVADTYAYTIRKITPAGAVTTLAGMSGMPGSADGTGTAASFGAALGVAVDGAGNVYVADSDNDTIRKITPDGVVTTLAGSGWNGSVDGTGIMARFDFPEGIAVDEAGNVYVADTGNNVIRKITPAGAVTTLAGTVGLLDLPSSVAVDGSGNVYVADTGNNAIRRIAPSGVVSTIAGVPSQVSRGNFPGPLPASLYQPRGVAVNPSTGSLYITLDAAVMVVDFAQ